MFTDNTHIYITWAKKSWLKTLSKNRIAGSTMFLHLPLCPHPFCSCCILQLLRFKISTTTSHPPSSVALPRAQCMCHTAKAITQGKGSYSGRKCRYLRQPLLLFEITVCIPTQIHLHMGHRKGALFEIMVCVLTQIHLHVALKRGDTNKISPALNTLSPKHYTVTFSLICLFHFTLPHLRNPTNPSASLVVRVQDSGCCLQELWALERQVKITGSLTKTLEICTPEIHRSN